MGLITLNRTTSEYLYKGEKKKEGAWRGRERQLSACSSFIGSLSTLCQHLHRFRLDRETRGQQLQTAVSNDMVASLNCKSSGRVACIRLKMLQPLDTRCWTTIRPYCLTGAGGRGENIYINIWRSNFCLPGLHKIKYQITIFLSEAYLPAQRLFCQLFHAPFVLLLLLCHGTQIFPKKHMQVWVHIYLYFWWFCCISSQLQQQLWRIFVMGSITDQKNPGPKPQWKSCTWQASPLGIVPHDPKWTKQEVFDLLGFCGKHLLTTP